MYRGGESTPGLRPSLLNCEVAVVPLTDAQTALAGRVRIVNPHETWVSRQPYTPVPQRENSVDGGVAISCKGEGP